MGQTDREPRNKIKSKLTTFVFYTYYFCLFVYIDITIMSLWRILLVIMVWGKSNIATRPCSKRNVLITTGWITRKSAAGTCVVSGWKILNHGDRLTFHQATFSSNTFVYDQMPAELRTIPSASAVLSMLMHKPLMINNWWEENIERRKVKDKKKKKSKQQVRWDTLIPQRPLGSPGLSRAPLPYLASAGGDHSKVSWDAVSPFDLHQISLHHKLGIDMHLLPLPDHQRLLAWAKRKRETRRKREHEEGRESLGTEGGFSQGKREREREER